MEGDDFRPPAKQRGRQAKTPPALLGLDLIVTGAGIPKPIMANVVTYLRSEQEFFNLCYDEFSQRPYRGDQLLTDTDFLDMTNHVQLAGIHADVRTVTNAAIYVAQECRFHQVRDYLDSLTWDSVLRLEQCLIDHGGAADTPLTRAMTQRWFIQAVARIYEPGCQADSMLILEGDQGMRKSGFFEAIANPWFSDSISDLGSKDSKQDIRGVWIVEMSEMSSMTRAEVGQAKAFITRRDDVFRESYGRLAEHHPRQTVFAGTINPGGDGYLKDETGARRYWPISITHEINLDAIRANRDAYWAEARAYYLQGHPWYLNTPELSASATEAQAERYEIDPWADIIDAWLEGKNETTVPDILRFALNLSSVADWGKMEQMRVGRCMKHLGWLKKRHRDGRRLSWKHVRLEQARTNDEDGTDKLLI